MAGQPSISAFVSVCMLAIAATPVAVFVGGLDLSRAEAKASWEATATDGMALSGHTGAAEGECGQGTRCEYTWDEEVFTLTVAAD